MIERIETHLRELLHAGRQPPPSGGAGPIVQELVDPAFVKDRLADIQSHAADADRPPKVAADRYAEAFSDLDQAIRDAPGQPYMPHSATASLAQSALSRCIESRIQHVLDELPHGDSAIDRAIRAAVSLFRRFGPCDPGWIETKIAEGIAHLEGRPEFPNQPAPSVPLAPDARVIIVGDWGTGLPGAIQVGQQMRTVIESEPGRECHVIHLGDVYYSGWPEEYQDRFLRYWPVDRADDRVLSWSLSGNHDMYSGGHGYFDVLLRDPRFRGHRLPDGADHHGSSHFSLENDYWQILGLDTGYRDHDLAGDQAAWVEKKLSESARKTMLLTHHQPFSSFEEVTAPMVKTLEPAFAARKIDAWLWGHEHRAIVYQRNDADYLDFGACIGHGGIPVLMTGVEIAQHPRVTWAFTESDHNNGNNWGLHGFAVMEFDHAALSIRFVDQQGDTNYQEQVFDNA